MLDIFTVSLFGHRQLSDPLRVEAALEDIIRPLLAGKEYVEFLIGRSGEFDLLAASVIRRCKRQYRDDNSSLTLVLPYMTAEYRNNEESFCRYYDGVLICGDSAGKHFKSAYSIRNRSMIDHSDLAIFFVEHPSGGAFQALRYAHASKTPFINVADTLL